MARFSPIGAYEEILRSLAQAAIVFGAGFVLTVVARKRPWLAGAAALILMTADLASANARYVLTVPQSVFDTKPEILAKIEAAERDQPSPAARTAFIACPSGARWVGHNTPSKDRVFELISWEHDTIQPKYGINLRRRIHPYDGSRRAL